VLLVSLAHQDGDETRGEDCGQQQTQCQRGCRTHNDNLTEGHSGCLGLRRN
jgi:hypothetical protein